MNLTQNPARLRTSLNGTWQIQSTNDETPPVKWDHSVPVPALVDTAVPKYDWRKFRFHWHKTGFRAENNYDLAFIVIEQAMFGTDVWLNGSHLGGDIACYTSQEYAARALLKSGENELLVRVGRKEDLPPESAVGSDQERAEWIPGIWGDVHFLQSGNPRVKLVQVIPHIQTGSAEVRVTLENLSEESKRVALHLTISEANSRKEVGRFDGKEISLKPRETKTLTAGISIAGMQLWSPESPFLYALETTALNPDSQRDSCETIFGMREFKIVKGDFHFNGNKIFLRGGNIAFHRFLSDADRGTLPWSQDWIRKALIDIPKAHNFNFFRNHLGQMYNRWYDTADRYGMLIQNEWPFWTTTGAKGQIAKEFTRWLQDNWNHPSIIIWDALNESTDPVVQTQIVPEMKQLDPTRPWESVDFVEQHPYIFSLGPAPNDRKFGYSEALQELEKASTPSVVNEFVWWWLDKNSKPTTLTKDVVERWLGRHYTAEEVIDHQSFLAQELVELFRRMRIDAIQPFVYLSNNEGATGNWFLGNIKDLQPKPILRTLKNAFSPFGLSLDLWDRHYSARETRAIRLFVFNDGPVKETGIVRYGIVSAAGGWLSKHHIQISVGGSGMSIVPIEVRLPDDPGEYKIAASLLSEKGGEEVARSQKIVHVFERARITGSGAHVAILSNNRELPEFLGTHGVKVSGFENADFHDVRAVIIGEGMLNDLLYLQRLRLLTQFIGDGGSLIVIEPEHGINRKEQVQILENLSLTILPREDADRGGYDSFVFAENLRHPLWKGISKEHLKMFNGGFGGEIVSQHDVICNQKSKVLASCGLKLRVVAVCEAKYGRGRVIVSRLQLRSRLMKARQSAPAGAGGLDPGLHPDSPYARRPDPVLRQYLLNLVSYACSIK